MQPKPADTGGNLMALPEGHVLVGDYHIRRVLGAGGFGITYLADDPALARVVTIKEYFPADFAARGGEIYASPRSQECEPDYKWGLDRFIEEAQTLAKFVHPNIVRVYRYFRANNTGYMVLHFEEGGSLKAWLKGLKRAPRQAELDAILVPLLDALEIVHKENFLHRDIAPDNIIIRTDGSPVLIDFGSARGDIAAHSRTVSALVKPGYSPYEQYGTDARQQGPWTDIYALGGTLYQAVTGKRPADAPTRMVNDEYVPARDAALSSYRPSFLAAIDKALALDMRARPQSIAEWRGALLAPAPKRAAKSPAVAKAAKNVDAEVVAAGPLAPAPPDAPQPKGQLLDFIEGLRKHRPAKAAAAVANVPARAEVPAAEKPRADPPKAKGHAEAEPERPPPRILKDRVKKTTAPRPRRMRGLALPSKRWRSLGYKLLIGIGIASLAVYLQDPLPQTQNRGQSAVTSQIADLAQVGQLVGHKGSVTALALLDQGRLVASTAADGTLKIWTAAAHALARTIELDDGPATALAVWPQDRRVLTGHKSGAIVLWDAEKAEKIAQFQHGEVPITRLAALSDGTRFVATNSGGALGLFDARNPSAAPQLIEPADAPQAAQLVAAAGARPMIAFSAAPQTLRLWQLDQVRGRSDGGRAVRTWRTATSTITALDISASGWSAGSGTADGAVQLWAAGSARGGRMLKLHEGRVQALAFSPGDRYLASAGEDGTVRLWDTRTGAEPRSLKLGAGPLTALDFSADGRRIYVGAVDGSIRVWTVATSGN